MLHLSRIFQTCLSRMRLQLPRIPLLPNSGVLGQFSNRSSIHTSSPLSDLMEFFDDKKNWGETKVRVGRGWRVDELRLKSNEELHKLWYILLKERNMLFTMEHESKRQIKLFPNPERIDKVEESMENIEAVVRERNRAYHQLETGLSGERPGGEIENFLGLQEYVQYEEHTLPKDVNKPYLITKENEPKVEPSEKAWFLVRLKAKQRKEERARVKRQYFEVVNILRHYPNTDMELLQERYPDVDVGKLKNKYNEEDWTNTKHLNYMEMNRFRLRLSRR